jgi:hypothetical protein
MAPSLAPSLFPVSVTIADGCVHHHHSIQRSLPFIPFVLGSSGIDRRERGHRGSGDESVPGLVFSLIPLAGRRPIGHS